MKILILAPQPFFQERGTPIAVKLLAEALSKNPSLELHLLTYLEGEDIGLPAEITHHRSWAPSWLYGVKPGLSLKKLLLDVFFFFSFLRILKRIKPDLIHGVEESAFMVRLLSFAKPMKYIFDMDSKVVAQAVSKWGILSLAKPILCAIEHSTIRNAEAVIAVCPVIANYAESKQAKKVFLLPDISLLEASDSKANLKEELGIPDASTLIVYVGNFEKYQGIDLFLESMAVIAPTFRHVHAILVGGRPEHIAGYREKALRLDITSQTHFPGPKPSKELKSILAQADVVVSPRTIGENTPMKLYSYLDSGTPLVATKLTTHTQIISEDHAFLANPTPEEFAVALKKALTNKEEAKRRADNAKNLVQEKYTLAAYEKIVENIFEVFLDRGLA